MHSNRVRQARESRGWTQTALAERALLTRQSVGAIEAGRAVPGVDVALRLATALECSVEELFGSERVDSPIEAELSGPAATPRVALAFLGGRWVAHPIDAGGLHAAADGLVEKSDGPRRQVTPLRPLAASRDNVLLMGCAIGIGLLTERLNSFAGGGRFVWLPASSGAALDALTHARTHIAGVHWTSADDGVDANVAAVKRADASEPLELVTLARWEAGLLLRPDDRCIDAASDLTAPGIRLVAREKGSGARRLLERTLQQAGAPAAHLGEALVAAGHLDVARAIAMGAADVGVATRDAALAFGLRFVPLVQERYDLVIPQALMADARVERLLDVLVSQASRRELESLGYDVSSAGSHVAQVSAA